MGERDNFLAFLEAPRFAQLLSLLAVHSKILDNDKSRAEESE